MIPYLKKACVPAILSGLVLVFFLKVVEQGTDLTVYTLLLNVDYIPLLNLFDLPEAIEVIIHLILSIFITAGFLVILNHYDIPMKYHMLFYIWMSLAVGLLLYPTTALSDRTPPLLSFSAFGYWLAGHFLYGLSLWSLLKQK